MLRAIAVALPRVVAPPRTTGALRRAFAPSSRRLMSDSGGANEKQEKERDETAAKDKQAKEKERDETAATDLQAAVDAKTSSSAGPYASRTDRDPFPAPNPALSRGEGAGLEDEAFVSGAVAGTFTPGIDDKKDDGVSPPPPAEGGTSAASSYPVERDPAVQGGMATRPRAEGTQLPPDP